MWCMWCVVSVVNVVHVVCVVRVVRVVHVVHKSSFIEHSHSATAPSQRRYNQNAVMVSVRGHYLHSRESGQVHPAAGDSLMERKNL